MFNDSSEELYTRNVDGRGRVPGFGIRRTNGVISLSSLGKIIGKNTKNACLAVLLRG